METTIPRIAPRTSPTCPRESATGGSRTPAKPQAAECVVSEMGALAVESIRIDPYRGLASTFPPYVTAFSAALPAPSRRCRDR
jgi:hypothetical protein